MTKSSLVGLSVAEVLTRRLAHILVAMLVLTVISVQAKQAGPLGSPTQPVPSFDVASVKRNKSGEIALRNLFSATRLFYGNVPLRVLIQYAYDVRDDRLTGGPSWVGTERFDVVGTFPQGTPARDLRLMMQGLLEDRFGLKVQREAKSMPVYVLSRQNPDHLGPGLTSTKLDCSSLDRSKLPRECGYEAIPGSIRGIGDWAAMRLPDRLALERQVVDRTGLAGNFDVNFTWSEDPTSASRDSVSVFTAVQEQLGLKLEAVVTPVDVLVIQAVRPPTED
jgi:uncharacterized protein (TIGR03435 family)